MAKRKKHPKPQKKQYFEPRNKHQAEQADILIECLGKPLNNNNNCHFLSEQEFSTNESMSNKEFYAMRRGKQLRF